MKYVPYLLILCVVLFTGNVAAQSCCVGETGDVNSDGNTTLTDLTLLVNALFVTFEPLPCPEEGNTSGDPNGDVTLTDLTRLVNKLFVTFEPTAPCLTNSAADIFIDEYAAGVTYEAFAGSKLDAVQIDAVTTYAGPQALIITVPDAGDPSGSYSGGAFTDSTARDLTSYNAVTFWAKASQPATLDVAGLGNDNTGTSIFTAERTALALTTDWQKFVLPVPLAEKLTSERGLFYFAEGPEGGLGYDFWIDELQFENLGTITNPRPALAAQTVVIETGQTETILNGSVTFDVDGTDITISAMPAYFTFSSTNPAVATVDSAGVISAVGEGSATITAMLGSTSVTGSIAVTVSAPAAVPTTPAPTPTPDPADVVSLFSDVYTDVPVDTWSAGFDQADVEDYLIGSDSTKKYTNLVFAGIEFVSTTVDASAMTHFHMDVWTPDPTNAPSVFRVKLVDFGADNSFGGGDDSEFELTFNENTMNTGEWVGIDVPLTSFSGLASTANLAQLIISGNPNTVYVDNVYFYDAGVVNEPTVAAPTPTEDPGDVISLFSDVYTDVTVDTWSAPWDQADVADFAIGSDNTKQYTNLVFAGIEFWQTSTVDASAMTHFHMDVWTPDPTAAPAVFKVKLVDIGADNAFGGGDDVEHELTFDETTMQTGLWTSIDVPLADFLNLTTRGNLAQMIISGDPNTVFLDNVYFYTSSAPTEPTTAAPTPSQSPVDVISLYSDAYTDVPVDTWSAVWDQADVTDFVIGSDSTKRYSSLVFAGIEFWATSTVDASAMTHFHMDVWTPDPTGAPAVFKIKLVDIGADGVFGGGDDVEHEIILDENTMNTGSWVSLDIPLTDFANLTTRANLAQLIISGDPNTVFIDNIYFYDIGLPTAPTSAAPTPTFDAADVISIFSDAYTNVTVDTWSSMWDQADVSDAQVGSDNMKMYTNLNYAIIEFTTTTIDASAMTHFHIDVWTPDNTDAPAVFKVKLVDFGANGVWDGGGDDVEHELTFDASVMNTSEWVSLEPALSEFTNMTTKGHVAQLIISGDPNTMYVDNVYFHQ